MKTLVKVLFVTSLCCAFHCVAAQSVIERDNSGKQENARLQENASPQEDAILQEDAGMQENARPQEDTELLEKSEPSQDVGHHEHLEQLQQALIRHDRARIEFAYKMETGYIRRAERGDIVISAQKRDFIYNSPEAMIHAIQRHLKSLDHRGRTLALIYEPSENQSGVRLVTPDKVIYGGQSQTGKLVVELGDKLRIASRMANRLPVRQNSVKDTSEQVSDTLETLPDEAERRQDTVATANVPVSELSRLSMELLTPAIWSYLTAFGEGQLLILPAQGLGSVPFSILPLENGRALISEYRPIILPGVDGLFFWVKLADDYYGPNNIVIGDPDLSQDPVWDFVQLPGARKEASTVATMFRAAPLIGEYASYDRVVPHIRGKSLIYFATHGLADSENPMDSSFLALKGKHLTAAQIKRFHFPSNHPLVVMSACQSGLGKTFEGGIFGLSRAWIYAGAAQVLASQWNVADDPTAYMMEKFMYSVRLGGNTMLAYQRAVLRTRAEYPDPVLWGSFNLFGYPQPIRIPGQ